MLTSIEPSFSGLPLSSRDSALSSTHSPARSTALQTQSGIAKTKLGERRETPGREPLSRKVLLDTHTLAPNGSLPTLGKDKCFWCFYSSYHTRCEDHAAVWRAVTPRRSFQEGREERIIRIRYILAHDPACSSLNPRSLTGVYRLMRILAKDLAVEPSTVRADLRAMMRKSLI